MTPWSLGSWQPGDPDLLLRSHPLRTRSGRRGSRLGGAGRVLKVREAETWHHRRQCQDKGPLLHRPLPSAASDPRAPRPAPPRWGPGTVTGPSSSAAEPFILAAGSGRGTRPGSQTEGSPQGLLSALRQ